MCRNLLSGENSSFEEKKILVLSKKKKKVLWEGTFVNNDKPLR